MENNKPQDIRGVGMTSQRTRNRLVQRLRKQGIESEIILDVINSTPRPFLKMSSCRLILDGWHK